MNKFNKTLKRIFLSTEICEMFKVDKPKNWQDDMPSNRQKALKTDIVDDIDYVNGILNEKINASRQV